MSWHIPAGRGEGTEVVTITPERAGWDFTSLRVIKLEPGARYECDTADAEIVVLPLAGAAELDTSAGSAALAGRADVFAAVTDCAYVPVATRLALTSPGGGRFALAGARARAGCRSGTWPRRTCRSSCAALAPAPGRSTTSPCPACWKPTG